MMGEEAKAHVELQRAMQAKELLESPIYKEAIEKLDAAIVAVWKNCPEKEREQRESAFVFMKILGEFQKHFEHVVQRGVVAEKQLATLGKRKKIAGII